MVILTVKEVKSEYYDCGVRDEADGQQEKNDKKKVPLENYLSLL